MRVQHEVYKGIEFIRLAQLPPEEREKIFQTIEREKIIKILKDKELLSDCIQVADYQLWLQSQAKQVAETKEVVQTVAAEKLKLAFK